MVCYGTFQDPRADTLGLEGSSNDSFNFLCTPSEVPLTVDLHSSSSGDRDLDLLLSSLLKSLQISTSCSNTMENATENSSLDMKVPKAKAAEGVNAKLDVAWEPEPGHCSIKEFM